MTDIDPRQGTTHRLARLLAVGLLVAIAALTPAPAYLLASSPSPTTGPPSDVPPSEHRGAPAVIPDAPMAPPSEHRLGRAGALGAADGLIPRGTTVFADGVPGIDNLDPALLMALRRAATAARSDGVAFLLESGWRSSTYQEQLLREAISAYGSEKEAARWVATPETSPHVSGDAVDIGSTDASAWLSRRGAHYGLCQIYRNEPWHYELRPAAIDHGCPPMYADPTRDPRMSE